MSLGFFTELMRPICRGGGPLLASGAYGTRYRRRLLGT
jgi:predicted methyltransferase